MEHAPTEVKAWRTVSQSVYFNDLYVRRLLLVNAIVGGVNGSDEVELGYSLAAHSWGQGLATEMVQTILPIGFEDLRLSSVIALAYAGNIRSRTLAERMGFHFERETLWKGSQAMLYRLERRQ